MVVVRAAPALHSKSLLSLHYSCMAGGMVLNAMTTIIMPRCACASEVYGSVFVCVCVCGCVWVCTCRLLQLLKDESSASKSFYRRLVMFTWILICGFAK